MTGKELKGEKIIVLLLDKKPRELRFDFNALAEVEERLGGLEKLGKTDITTLKNLRMLAWAGILHLGENLSEQEVGALLPLGEALQPVSTALVNALNRDLGGEKNSKKDEKPQEN